jgi:formylglycine-generating enzyme required for sulfatase activity
MIPAGEYWVGAGDDDKFAASCEGPRRKVVLEHPFWMSVFPVTERERGGHSDLPAVRVSWHDATAHCRELTQRTGAAWRLPTGVEWEIACRAGAGTPFWCGFTIGTDQANYLHDESGRRVGPGRRTPPGTYPPNHFGLEDMAGNVLEWCAGEWAPGSPLREVRGGAWDLLPRLLRSSWRDGLPPDVRQDNLGFRLACDTPP